MCCRWEEEAATAAATEVLAMAEVKAAATEAEKGRSDARTAERERTQNRSQVRDLLMISPK